jgi:hypothetical protein
MQVHSLAWRRKLLAPLSRLYDAAESLHTNELQEEQGKRHD